MGTTTRMHRLKSQFHVTAWDEQPYDEGAGLSKLTRATVAVEYTGDLEYAPLWCGESCTLVNDIKPAADVVRDIANEAVQVLRQVSDRVT